MTLVKICGLRDVETAVETARAGADFVGLVFAESRRQVTPQQCSDIVDALHQRRAGGGGVRIDGPSPGDVPARSWFAAWAEAIELAAARARPLITGVFAGMTAGQVNDIAAAAKLDLVQLSGGEDDDFVSSINLPVIRVVHVRPGDDAASIEERCSPGRAAAVLLDTASPGALGGTGTVFDWAVAAGLAGRLPLMLAGGLDPANVASAVAQVRPWGVDVSSGVETAGTKDIAKIRAFIGAAKGAAVGN